MLPSGAGHDAVVTGRDVLAKTTYGRAPAAGLDVTNPEQIATALQQAD